MSGPTSGTHDRHITQGEGVDHVAQPRGLHPHRGRAAHDAVPPGIPRAAAADGAPPVLAPQPAVHAGRLMVAATPLQLSVSSDKMEDMAVDQAAPIFGRDRELAELVSALGLDPGAETTGESVLLGGDAGIGKTRVVTELVTIARASGRHVLVGHCLDLGDS